MGPSEEKQPEEHVDVSRQSAEQDNPVINSVEKDTHYPPLAKAILIMLALYISMFLVSLVRQECNHMPVKSN